MIALERYAEHPLVYANGILGFQGYTADDMFCVPANGDNNFLLHGIAEGSLLVVDRKLPFVEDELNMFQTGQIVHGKKQMKVSLTQLEGCPYVGRIIMSVNLYH